MNPQATQILSQIQDLFVQLQGALSKPESSEQKVGWYDNVYEAVKHNDWQYATTSEVSALTLEQYDYKPLLKYCRQRELHIPKTHICKLGLNAYPAIAWLEVYGIELGNFNV